MSIARPVEGASAGLKRSQTTFDDYPRRKPVKRSKTDLSITDEKYFDDAPGLEDVGIVRSLGTASSAGRVLDISSFVQENLFDSVLERAFGMNGTRTAEVLNFQTNLPPLLTTAHVLALSPSPSAAEREIANAVRLGKVRRFRVPGRGSGISNVSDLLITMPGMRRFLERSKIKETTREAYLNWLAENLFATIVPPNALKPEQTVELLKAGFLTSSAAASLGNTVSLSTLAEVGTATSISTVANAAAGSAQATGGHGATFGAGGGGAGVLQRNLQSGSQYQVTVPNTGAYLKLIIAARMHIVDLLKKTNRRESPMYLLKEYWEAGLSSKKTVSETTKKPFEKLLPGQTKKWKSFYGMKFEFAFQEAFGAGMIECFNTRAVGLGVRVT